VCHLVASVLAGRPRRCGALIILVAGLAVAVTRTLHQGQWMAGGVLIFVGLAAVLCRLVDAAISRQSEYAADRFAADHDPATELVMGPAFPGPGDLVFYRDGAVIG
jgi:hypothetical protein